ncbi:MAG TPA: S46 family peptidase [Pseudoxanthomonas sp.]|nr:S46 family peptidase [Pseudoxanthomonas sp.]
MNSRTPLSLLALGIALALPAHAYEGMWMQSQLPELAKSMRDAGFEGDPATLADLTKPPLNAVVKVGGATGAFVSPDGLVLTNHHVAYGVIQYNSKPEKNLIDDGYTAADRAGELPANPDYRVLVTVGFDRVTEQVLKDAQGKTGRAYYDAVDAANKRIVSECEQEAGMRCSVATMYYGADFYRIKQLELRDIRLVYAPPRAIGNYGDEIDNFMWPRHTGDFTLLRAYVGKDGKPAAYSPDNVPYRAPAHLQIATDGPKEGDFAMLAGYPGVTYRHRFASEFKERIEWGLPASVEVLDALIAIVQQRGKADPAAGVKYASQLSSLKNSSKRFSGELEGLRRSNAIQVRADAQKAMYAWLASSGGNAKATRASIDQAQTLLDGASAMRERDLLLNLLPVQSQLLKTALTAQRWAQERGKPDAQRESGYQDRDLALIEGQFKQVQRRYDAGMERALLTELLGRYQKLPDAQRLPEFDAAFGRDAASLAATLERVYAGTRLGDEATRLALLKADPTTIQQSDDPLLALAAQLQPAFLRKEEQGKQREGDLLRLRPAYMQALMGYYRSQGRSVYPDANSTLRVSYGTVEALHPRDSVTYSPVTTVAGIVEKNTNSVPFDAPKPLLAAIAKGDFGSTADPVLKTQTVNFLTNLDTTGGNSGSPVLNARGQLIGLNFDSNWESVSASWMFDPRYKRAVHVDMRYLRWLLAKVQPAPHLLKEMNLPAE